MARRQQRESPVTLHQFGYGIGKVVLTAIGLHRGI
jgi:hypothetical protein